MAQLLRRDYRTETKFLLSVPQKIALESRLQQLFAADIHGVNGQYPVMSRYFDTPDLEFFHQKTEGEYFHTKIRARRYSKSLLSGSPLYLESKIKQNALQHKIRLKDVDNNSLLPEKWDECKEPGREFFLDWRARHRLVPTCHVFYTRRAYELIDQDCGKIRVNFDYGITPLWPSEYEMNEDLVRQRNLLGEHRVLMEIKHDGVDVPEIISQECRWLGIQQISFSKYANCLLALDEGMQRIVG